MYKPSELKAFLAEIDAGPKKGLSQNFLIDGNIVRKIVHLADVKSGDTVLEIGPGPGALTQELLHLGAHVIAVEKDRKFAAALHRLQTPDQRLTIYEDDALTWNKPLSHGTKLIANLPYNITTPLLTRFLPQRDIFESLTIMVQREVADRMIAPCGSKTYGSLSVFVQFYARPLKYFVVEPTCFYPPPKVQSAVLKLHLIPPPLHDEEAFFTMTRRAFNMRRKMVLTTLKKFYPQPLLEQGLLKIGKGLKVRPEELSLSDFVVLFEEVQQQH